MGSKEKRKESKGKKGEPRPFADFIHGLQLPGAYELPLATTFAEEIDLIVIKLLVNCWMHIGRVIWWHSSKRSLSAVG